MTGSRRLAWVAAVASAALAVAVCWSIGRVVATATIAERVAGSEEIALIIADLSVPEEIRETCEYARNQLARGELEDARKTRSEAGRMAATRVTRASFVAVLMTFLLAVSTALATYLLTYPQPAAPIGLRIHYARIARRMTQRDLAEATGCNQTRICRVEKGESRPTEAMLRWLRRNEVPRWPGNPAEES